MKQYLELMQYIMEHGTLKQNRTGIRTKSIFGHQMRFKLNEGFPLVNLLSISNSRKNNLIV